MQPLSGQADASNSTLRAQLALHKVFRHDVCPTRVVNGGGPSSLEKLPDEAALITDDVGRGLRMPGNHKGGCGVQSTC